MRSCGSGRRRSGRRLVLAARDALDRIEGARREQDRVVLAAAEFGQGVEATQLHGGRIAVDGRSFLEMAGHFDLLLRADDFSLAFALGSGLHGHGFHDRVVLDFHGLDLEREDFDAPVLDLRLQSLDGLVAELLALVQEVVERLRCGELGHRDESSGLEGLRSIHHVHTEILDFVFGESLRDGEDQTERHIVARLDTVHTERQYDVVDVLGFPKGVEDRFDPVEAGADRPHVLTKAENRNTRPLIDDRDAAEEVDARHAQDRRQDAEALGQDRVLLDVGQAEDEAADGFDQDQEDDEWQCHGTPLRKWPKLAGSLYIQKIHKFSANL